MKLWNNNFLKAKMFGITRGLANNNILCELFLQFLYIIQYCFSIFLSYMVSCTKALTKPYRVLLVFTEYRVYIRWNYVTVQLEETQILPNPKHTFNYFFKWIFPWPFQNPMEAYFRGALDPFALLQMKQKKLSKSILFAVENNMKITSVLATQTWFQGLCYTLHTKVFGVICSCFYLVARVLWVIAMWLPTPVSILRYHSFNEILVVCFICGVKKNPRQTVWKSNTLVLKPQDFRYHSCL